MVSSKPMISLVCVTFSILLTSFQLALAQKIKLEGNILKESVCNSGSAASYYISDDDHSKLFFYFQGGGSARSSQGYLIRKSSLKKSMVVDRGKLKISKAGGFPEIQKEGYKIIYIPYCSSDVFMGQHSHLVNGESVPFEGYSLMKEVSQVFSKQIASAEEVVLAGTSAGAIAVSVGYNLFSRYNKNTAPRLLVDSFWLDTQEYRARLQFETNYFVHKSLPEGCEDPLECFPSEKRLANLKVEDAFIIWNLGDLYRFARNDSRTITELENVMSTYGGGISIGKGYVVKGKLGQHGILDSKAFYQTIDEVKLGNVILNWLKKEGDRKLVVSNNEEPEVEDITDRLQVKAKLDDDTPVVIIASDWDCDGHTELSENLERWGYQSIYVNHCKNRLRSDFIIQRIRYSGVTIDQMVHDLLLTIELVLSKNPKRKVVLIGHAQGGAAVNALVDENMLIRVASKYGFPIEFAYKIAGAVSYYPLCQAHRIPKRPTVNFLVELAGDDKLDLPFMGCEEGKSRQAGALKINVVPNAPHGFDKASYVGTNIRSGKSKVGQHYIIKYDATAAKASFKRLKAFLKKSTRSLLQTIFLEFNLEDRKRIQAFLIKEGLYDSSVDGLYGRKTSQGLKSFAEKNFENINLENPNELKKILDYILVQI